MKKKESNLKNLFEKKWCTFPNFLSFLRLFLVIPFVYFANQYSLFYETKTLLIVFWIIFIIGITDFLDGYLARCLNQKTKLGQYLDPFCDKVVSISSLFLLFYAYGFPLWALLFYLLREILGTWGGLYLYFKFNRQGNPNVWGKIGVFLTALLVLWYIAVPWIESQEFPIIIKDWLIRPYLLVYVWAGNLLIGLLSYSRTYGHLLPFLKGK